MTINSKCGLWRNGVTKTDLSSLIKEGVDGKCEQGLLKVGKATLSLSQMLNKALMLTKEKDFSFS